MLHRPLPIIRTLILGSLLALGAGGAWGANLLCAGDWSLTIDAACLQAGPGSDLVTVQTSDAAQSTLTVSNTAGVDAGWRVDVRRFDTRWDNSVSLQIRRTGDGAGGGDVSGGESFLTIGTTDATFFSGAGDRADLTLQLRLSGLSVTVPSDTYATTIIFTVVDTQ